MRVGGRTPVRVRQTERVSISYDLNSAGERPEGVSGRTRPRVGLLGTGPWARRTQAPALAAHAGSEFAGGGAAAPKRRPRWPGSTA